MCCDNRPVVLRPAATLDLPDPSLYRVWATARRVSLPWLVVGMFSRLGYQRPLATQLEPRAMRQMCRWQLYQLRPGHARRPRVTTPGWPCKLRSRYQQQKAIFRWQAYQLQAAGMGPRRMVLLWLYGTISATLRWHMQWLPSSFRTTLTTAFDKTLSVLHA